MGKQDMGSSLITEFDVEALVDSQLNWEDEKRVRRGIEASPVLRDYYSQLVAQKKLLIAWWENRPKNKADGDS